MVATPVTNELLDKVCAALSLPLLELASHFVDHGVNSCNASEVTFANDPHWNELGNQIVAGAIEAGMRRLPDAHVRTARSPQA